MIIASLISIRQNILFIKTVMTSKIKLFESQVSGKSAKFSDSEGKEVYKQLSKTQFKFYTFMDRLQIHQGEYVLKKHIPKFLGKKNIEVSAIITEFDQKSKKGEWMSHISDRFLANQSTDSQKQYIALENLSVNYGYPCVMDIKLGRKRKSKKSNKKFQKSTTNSHHFRINGMSNLYVEQKEPHFISKYYFQKTSEEEIQAHLAFFFFDGNTIDQNLIQNCVEIIKQIVLSLQCFKAGSFDSASLLIMYDALDHRKFSVKIIDFDQYFPDSHHSHHSADENIIIGLKYIIWYLNNIKSQVNIHIDDIKNKRLKLFNTQLGIPEQKLKEFASPKSKNSLQSQISSPPKSPRSPRSPRSMKSPKSLKSKGSEQNIDPACEIEIKILGSDY